MATFLQVLNTFSYHTKCYKLVILQTIFFIQHGINVSEAYPPALTDRPYLAVFKFMKILKVKCSNIMTLLFNNILSQIFIQTVLQKSFKSRSKQETQKRHKT